jgi:hypothetical protein
MASIRSTVKYAAVITLALGMAAGACRSGSPGAAPDAGTKTVQWILGSSSVQPAPPQIIDAGPLATGIPVPASKVKGEINKAGREPYAGPTGAVEGTVRVSGDAAPVTPIQAPAQCTDAVAMYGKLFREGPGRTVADAMVGVTLFDGFVPARSDVYPVAIRGCAYDRRTIALAYGQRLEVKNYDASEPYLPELLGAKLPAKLLALPRGDAVRLYPMEVGQYVLTELMGKDWMKADVFVVRFATHAVTGLDGHYRIDGLPVGDLQVSAFLPAIGSDKTVDRKVVVKAGETTKVDFVLPFKAEKASKSAPAAPGAAVIK